MSEKKANYTTRKFYDPIDDILDRPIAFNPAFKKITGSTVAALMLSQAWYWSKRTSDEQGWFYKTIAEWEDETGLTRSEQETARKHLKGILEVDLRGVPATLFYRINREKVMNLLGIQFAGTLQTSLPESSEQVRDNPANINRTEITTETTTEIEEDVSPSTMMVYTQEIGLLTPFIANALEDWETLVPPQWVTDAINIAAKNNARSWSYVEVILKRWKAQGNQNDAKQARKKSKTADLDDLFAQARAQALAEGSL